LYAQPLLAIAGSIIALATQSIYASLTPVFLPQALAQDIANLAPLWLLLAALALRGSLRALLLWLGVLTFTVYKVTRSNCSAQDFGSRRKTSIVSEAATSEVSIRQMPEQ
jgi:hypothetical protein